MEMMALVQPKTMARSTVWPAVAVFLIALAVRVVAGATVPLFRDEAWHLLAAHSWIHEGTLRVDQGAYTRAGYFTVLVAWFMEALGETLAVARLPGTLAGAALVVAVFVWLRRKSGMIAAWTGAMLLCFHDVSIQLSAEVRFYSLHALCLWLTAAIVYQVTVGDRSQRQPVWMLMIAAAFSIVALYVQVTAGVALVATAAWAICDLAYQYRSRLWRAVRNHRVLAAAIGAVVLGGAVGMALYTPTPLAQLYGAFRHAPAWAEQGRDWVFYYHRYYSGTIPLLWTLFPVAFLAALMHRPRAAIFCAFLFVVPMAIMSFGAQKQYRYVFFALPYLFAIWGLAVEAMFPKAAQLGFEMWNRLWEMFVGSEPRMTTGKQRLRRYGVAAAAILMVSFAIISQASYRESAKLIVTSALTALSRPAQLWTGPALEPWVSHRDELMTRIKRASIFLAAMPSTTLYELGPFDLILTRMEAIEDFGIDPRVGRPQIATVESLQAILSCYQTGIVIVPSKFWRMKDGVPEDVADLLAANSRMTRFSAPGWPDDDLLVFEWEGPPNAASQQCDEVRSRMASGIGR